MARTLVGALLTVAVLAGCGGSSSKDPATSADATQDAVKTDTPSDGEAKSSEGGETAEKTDSGSDAPAEKPKAPAKQESEFETLARDIVKSGGRRIGFSAAKKMFAVPSEKRTETNFGIDVMFHGEDGAGRDPMRICQPGECEEHMNEKLDELLPKLAQKLEADGYVNVRGIGWPDGRDELEVSSLGMKLKFRNGRIEGLKEGKPPVIFQTMGGRLDVSEIKAIYIIADSKLMGLFGKPSRPSGVVQTFYVLKMP